MTWLDINPEHQVTLIDAVTSVVTEQLGNNGYLGSCFATIGRRNYTFTAWENVEAATAALRTGAHAAAMRLAKVGGLAITPSVSPASGNQKCSTGSSTPVGPNPVT